MGKEKFQPFHIGLCREDILRLPETIREYMEVNAVKQRGSSRGVIYSFELEKALKALELLAKWVNDDLAP